MKFFFTSGIQTANGENLSNTSVKDMIADLFKKEDTRKPLSDQEVKNIIQASIAEAGARHGFLPRGRREVMVDVDATQARPLGAAPLRGAGAEGRAEKTV